MKLIVTKSENDSVWFESQLEIIKKEHAELGLENEPTEVVAVSFKASSVVAFYPTDFKEHEGFNQVWVDLQGGESYAIDCPYDEFKKALAEL